MSASVNAGIFLGAVISISEFDQYKVETEAKTRTEKRYSQTTGKPVKDAVIVEQRAQWGYRFAEGIEALSDDATQDIRQLDFLDTLGQFMGLEASYVLDGEAPTRVLIGESVGSNVDCDAYDDFALVGAPITDFSDLTKRANRIKKVLKQKLGYTPVVGLITALDINQ